MGHLTTNARLEILPHRREPHAIRRLAWTDGLREVDSRESERAWIQN
jgi:hypothetical protein